MIRKSKNYTYICPQCFKPFKVECKEQYSFIYNDLIFCSRKCLKEYRLFKTQLENAGLKGR